MQPLELFLERFPHAKRLGNGWYHDHCPAHDDQHASFGFREQPDGHVMLKCQAGCRQGNILSAIGLRVRDLYPENAENNGAKPPPIITYDYHDAAGKLVFQVVRTPEKKFFQRRPDGMGGWINDMRGVTRVLYHLPEVVAAVRAGQIVWVCEGEKDADNLHALKLAATTNPAGAGKWQAIYSTCLAGANVVVLPDNDDAGRKHAALVLESIRETASSVRILALPGLPEKGDLSDWLAAGGTREDLERLAAAVKPEAPSIPNAGPVYFFDTDVANAQRFAARHGDKVRHFSASGKWLVWDGTRWHIDDLAEVGRLALDTVDHIYDEVSSLNSPDEKKALLKHARDSHSDSRIGRMLHLAEYQPGIAVRRRDFDTDPWLLNCTNGTLDLRTGILRAHSPTDRITKRAPVAFDDCAECPTWLSFLDRVLEGNERVIEFLRRALGYSLTGIATERVLFVAHGVGRNGKSTLLDTIRFVLGDYGARTPTETLLVRQGERVNNDIARLAGVRFVAAAESEKGGQLAEGLIKDLTGGEAIVARFLHQEHFEYHPEFKLWLGTNHIPHVRGTDEAIWDRLRLINFGVRIPEAEVDRDLPRKLRVEAGGILRWMTEGCRAWQADGLTYPAEVRKATRQFRADMDTLIDFLDARCILGAREFVAAQALYEEYRAWCLGTEIEPESNPQFAARLKERGFSREHTRAGARWYGLCLQSDAGKEKISDALL